MTRDEDRKSRGKNGTNRRTGGGKGVKEAIEARRACNHADGSANISAGRFPPPPPPPSPLRLALFSLDGVPVAIIGQPSAPAVTYVVHFVFKQCGNRRERGNVYDRNTYPGSSRNIAREPRALVLDPLANRRNR